jgi:DNA-binding PadR family transcriptional regulator
MTPVDEFLPLSESTFHVLIAVADRPRHGYAIMQEVAERTDGSVTLGPGTLYTTLKRLVAGGLVEETDGPASNEDGRRRYYRLTPGGRAVARAEADRLVRLVRIAEQKRLVKWRPA